MAESKTCHPNPGAATCQLSGPPLLPFEFCFFWPTEPLSLRASSVPLVPVSPCQHVPSRKRVSPCHRAHVSPARLRRALANRPTDQPIN